MPARHEGMRSRVVSGLHPNAKKHLDQVYKQIWKDVRKRRVLVVRKGNPLLQDTISSPFEAVDKMLPDRTIAPDKRVVHDQRQVNAGSDKTWHPPALQPTHQQIARRVLWCRTRFPGLPVLIAKKDIAGAFRLLWVAPEDVPLFAGDLPWKEDFMVKTPSEDNEGREREDREGEDMTVLYLVSSFGFLGRSGAGQRRSSIGPTGRRMRGETVRQVLIARSWSMMPCWWSLSWDYGHGCQRAVMKLG